VRTNNSPSNAPGNLERHHSASRLTTTPGNRVRSLPLTLLRPQHPPTPSETQQFPLLHSAISTLHSHPNPLHPSRPPSARLAFTLGRALPLAHDSERTAPRMAASLAGPNPRRQSRALATPPCPPLHSSTLRSSAPIRSAPGHCGASITRHWRNPCIAPSWRSPQHQVRRGSQRVEPRKRGWKPLPRGLMPLAPK
jgi:hypothetical protein